MNSKVETPRKKNCQNIDLTKLFGTCMEKDRARKKLKEFHSHMAYIFVAQFRIEYTKKKKKGKRIKKRKQNPI